MDQNDSVTAKYQLNAAALLSVNGSQSLAALYATRARLTSSQPSTLLPLSPLHCPRCAHLPVSTRVVSATANPISISKQRKTTNRSLSSRARTMNTKTSNKAQPVHTRMSSSSNETQETRTTRGRRVRVMKSCANCGYVGAAASERSVDYYENKRVISGTPVVSSCSPSVPVSRTASPGLNLETESRSSSLRETIVDSSAKLKGKPNAEAPIQTTNSIATTILPTIPAQSQPGISTPAPSPSISLPQSGSAVKRQKKKKKNAAGLQEMLARSKEQRQKEAKQEAGGLSAFLSGL